MGSTKPRLAIIDGTTRVILFENGQKVATLSPVTEDLWEKLVWPFLRQDVPTLEGGKEVEVEFVPDEPAVERPEDAGCPAPCAPCAPSSEKRDFLCLVPSPSE